MWELIFNVLDVTFEFGSPKRKTHKKFKNISPFKTFKTICFQNKKNEKINKICNSYGLMKIWSNFNHSKILNYQQLRFSNKMFLI